ncbi:MAG: GNAT family N-acetyltransferase, partial [Pseudomonadota bacterium]
MTEIVAEKWEEAAAREALLDLCMPERHLKSSERIREGRLPADGLSLAAHGPDGRLVATVRLWHVTAGPGKPALLLGPLAVHPWFRSAGLGGAMMGAALQAARGR